MIPALAYIPFINPIDLPSWLRLWTFLPLAFCVALVYRATRAHSTDRLVWRSCITFANIIVGMIVIALGAYGLHAGVLWWSE